MKSGKYYWVLNVEFHYIDSTGRPVETATVQIDVGNGERFNITYIDEDGSKKHPVILHTAIHGSLERFLFEFLEEAAKMEKRGEKPRLPTWLSPIQVRILPVNIKEHLGETVKLMEYLEGFNIRVDVDDRDLTLGRRIKDAEVSWIPYIIILGDREVRTGLLSVRNREGKVMEMSREEFVALMERELDGYPREPLYVNKFLSKRATFA